MNIIIDLFFASQTFPFSHINMLFHCIVKIFGVKAPHLEVLGEVLAGLVQLVLVQDHIEHLGRALGQLLRRHQLHVDVAGLGLQTMITLVGLK